MKLSVILLNYTASIVSGSWNLILLFSTTNLPFTALLYASGGGGGGGAFEVFSHLPIAVHWTIARAQRSLWVFVRSFGNCPQVEQNINSSFPRTSYPARPRSQFLQLAVATSNRLNNVWQSAILFRSKILASPLNFLCDVLKCFTSDRNF